MAGNHRNSPRAQSRSVRTLPLNARKPVTKVLAYRPQGHFPITLISIQLTF